MSDAPLPDPAFADAFVLRCPKDGTPMKKVREGTLTLDRCPKCSAMWLDALELQLLLHMSGSADKVDPGTPKPTTHRPGELHCPRDRSPLITATDVKQAHVRYETCTVCGGMLFDAGEIHDLAHFNVAERVRSFFKG